MRRTQLESVEPSTIECLSGVNSPVKLRLCFGESEDRVVLKCQKH